MKAKVFCIGFHKTGTTSLTVALKMLGYTVTGPNGVRDPHIKDNVLPMAFKLVEQYDAFQDNPWPIIYKELDKAYPNSKFILSLRNSEFWINSQLKHFGEKVSPMREWIYGVGCPKGNEEIYLKRFEEHNREVQEYFKDRPEDLLILDVSSTENIWEKLCLFLGIEEIPDIPFPHANKGADREKKRASERQFKNRLSRLAKRVLKRFTNH